MSGEFDSRKDSHSAKFEQIPQIFVKLSFREFVIIQSYLNYIFFIQLQSFLLNYICLKIQSAANSRNSLNFKIKR